jgi:transcriptional regulator with XRE-family HTH domain
MPKKRNTSQYYAAVGGFLTTIRTAAKLSQRDLAAALDESQSWVAQSERNSRRVDVAEFALWCRACGVDPGRAIRELIKQLPNR